MADIARVVMALHEHLLGAEMLQSMADKIFKHCSKGRGMFCTDEGTMERVYQRE
jgi:hypothetical protein